MHFRRWRLIIKEIALGQRAVRSALKKLNLDSDGLRRCATKFLELASHFETGVGLPTKCLKIERFPPAISILGHLAGTRFAMSTVSGDTLMKALLLILVLFSSVSAFACNQKVLATDTQDLKAQANEEANQIFNQTLGSNNTPSTQQ